MDIVTTKPKWPSLEQVYFPVQRNPVLILIWSILWNIAPREYTVKLCPPRERNTENDLFQYYPTFEDIKENKNIYS